MKLQSLLCHIEPGQTLSPLSLSFLISNNTILMTYEGQCLTFSGALWYPDRSGHKTHKCLTLFP